MIRTVSLQLNNFALCAQFEVLAIKFGVAADARPRLGRAAKYSGSSGIFVCLRDVGGQLHLDGASHACVWPVGGCDWALGRWGGSARDCVVVAERAASGSLGGSAADSRRCAGGD